jgi:hypothetical protein
MLMGAAVAADFDYEASLGAGQSDNITRVAEDAQDENIATLGLKFSLDEQSRRLRADLLGDLAYYDYLDGTYDSELLGNVIANANLGVVPERLDWVFGDRFGQVLVDPFTPPTPDNRENLNYLSTGPEATFAFGSQTRLGIGARYVDSIYEDSPFDSSGFLGQVGVTRLLSSASELGLNLRHEQIEYDEESLNGDYDHSEAFAQYALNGARTNVKLDAGYTTIDRDAVNDKDSGPLFRLEVSRRIGRLQELTLDAGREFSSSGSAFAGEQSDEAIGLEPVASRQTVAPFTNEYASLYWSISGHRTEISLGGAWRKHEYQDSNDLNQTLTSVDAGVQRSLTPALTLSLDLAYSSSDFEVSGDYSDLLGSLALRWRMSRSLSLSLDYTHYDRNSDLAEGDYTENRIMLSIGYGRGAPRSRVLPARAKGEGE